MRIGIIGTGIMGSGLAHCLSKRGVELGYYNRTRSKAEVLAKELGGVVYDSPRKLLEESDFVVVFLATDEALNSVVVDIARSGTMKISKVFINASTVTPMASLSAMSVVESIGVPYVEAPVYGSVDEAHDCKLISIAACRENVFEDCEKVLKLYSSKVFYVGLPPKASVLKLALNNIGLAIPAVLAESLMLLEAWSVEVDTFRKIVNELWFGQLLERYWPRVLGERPPRFKAWMAGKDYWYIASALKAKGLPATLSDGFSALYYFASTSGYAEKDYPQVTKYYMELGKKASRRD